MGHLALLATQTDFSEPGELGLFIDESQIGLLDNITKGQGFLSGRQMAGSFQSLHSRDLVWTRQMREYLIRTGASPAGLPAGAPLGPRPLDGSGPLAGPGEAPGRYVMVRYAE